MLKKLIFPVLSSVFSVSAESHPLDGGIFLKENTEFFLSMDWWVLFGWIGAILSAFLLGGLLCYVLFQRRISRILAVQNALPVRVYVCDRLGNILYIHRESGVRCGLFEKKYFNIADMPWVQKKNMLDAVRNVYDYEKPLSLDYGNFGIQRTIIFTILKDSVFGDKSVLAVSSDSSCLQSQVEKLTGKLQLLSQIEERIGEGVIVVNSEKKIIQMNPAACVLTGWRLEDSMDRLLPEIFSLTGISRAKSNPLSEWMKTGAFECAGERFILKRQDGETFRIDLSMFPVSSGENGIPGTILIFHDVSEEYDRREENRLQTLLLKDVCKNLNLSFFRYCFDTDDTTLLMGHQIFYPNSPETKISLKRWLTTDSMNRLKEHFQTARSSGKTSFRCNVSSEYGDVARHYVFCATIRAESELIGFMMNVTDEFNRQNQYQDLLSLMDSIMNHIPFPVYTKDIEDQFRYIRVNKAFSSQLGFPEAEIIGKTDYEIFKNPVDVDAIRAHDLSVKRGDKSVYKEKETCVSHDGISHIVESSKQLITLSNGKKILLGISVDVTESEKMLAHLREHSQIFEKIDIPLLMFDLERRIVALNGSCMKLFHLTEEQGYGRFCFDGACVNAGSLRCSEKDCPVWRTISTGKSSDLELWVNGKYLRFQVSPLFDKDGRMTHVLEHVIDLTDEYRSREVLKRQKEELALFNRKLQSYAMIEKTIHTCMESLVKSFHFDESLNLLLDMIGRQTEASVCAVLKFVPEDSCFKTLQFRSSEKGESEYRGLIVPESRYPLIVERLRHGEVVQWIRETEQTETSASAKKEIMALLNEFSLEELIMVPVRFRGVFWGMLGIGNRKNTGHFISEGGRLLSAASQIVEILLEREERLRIHRSVETEKQMILNLLPIPLLLFDSEMNILNANPAAQSLADCSEGVLQKIPCNSVFCESRDFFPEDCLVKKTIQTGLPQTGEIQIKDCLFLQNTMPLTENGKVMKVLLCLKDVSEMSRSRELLRQAAQSAEDASRAKSMFLASLSHVIRTPLNTVIGFSELLKNEDVSSEKRNEYLDTILNAGNLLLHLIQDILALSKIESDEMNPNPVPSDLTLLFGELESLFRLEAEKKKLIFHTKLQPGLPNLMLDSSLLRQILYLLLENAIKFTTDGGVELSVSFVADQERSGTLTVCLKDTGIGIPSERQRSIFELFPKECLFSDDKRGLHLNLVLRIVKKMGGEMKLKSDPGKGSCFLLTFPNVETTSFSGKAELPPEIGAEMLQTHSVLIVDDVPLNVKVLEVMMKRFGFKVKTASSGKEALELLETETPEWIMTDLWMPGLNGVEFANIVRRKESLRKTRIIAVTADAEHDKNFDEGCFDAVLLKPVTIDQLKSVLNGIPSENQG